MAEAGDPWNSTATPLPILESVLNFDGTEETPCRRKQLTEDPLVLVEGFDSLADSLSMLRNNLENALLEVKELANRGTVKEEFVEENIERKKKRRRTSVVPTRETDEGKLKQAEQLAVSMAAKAATLAKELEWMKSEMCLIQDRCALLEEENGRLAAGDDDDLVRLQMEALLEEKSRLANANANLLRENQRLQQLVEYHQFNSRDLAESYEEILGLICENSTTPSPETGDSE